MAANDEFSQNLLRAVSAQLLLLNGMTAAREMFGKSYFSLGAGEKGAVDQAVLTMTAANYQSLTAETLRSTQTQQPVGFVAPSATPKQESSS